MKENIKSLAEKISELEELLQINRMLNTTADLQSTIEIIVDQAIKMVEAEAGTFWFLDAEQDALLPLVVRGPRAEALKDLQLQRGEGIAGQVIESGEPVLVEDVTRDSRWARRFDLATGFTTRSMLVLPFAAKGKAMGSLQLINKQNGVFSAEDLCKCRALAEHTAPILYNKYIYDIEQKLLFSLLKTLALLIEAGDPLNKGHAERVCHYSALIAEKLEMNEEEEKTLTFASLLHDIGKMVEEDTAKHPSAGAQLIYQMEPKSFIRQVWLGVLYHHEKYDGSGLPAGLKGKDIPLIARIIGLADFFDHFTRSREFKTLLEAAEEIKHYSGSYLDPLLVEIFRAAIKEKGL